ncbi:MAG: TAXI family TRAP transporter solute-binding subunit [Planctomycetota bacterium]|jgi:TRAP transporter TAXI family solute receptor
MSKANQKEYLPKSPFPGINPFSYAYKDVFFARDSDARSLIRLIVLYRGVLLYSDSGAGKSSLINAGIIPLAIKEGYQPERIRVQPKKDREIVVERLSEKVAGEPPFLPSIFASGEQQEDVVLSVQEFEKTLRQSAPPVHPPVHPLLIFDQFEEWATLFEGKAEDEARTTQKSIRDMIASLINDSTLPVKILIVLREDYLAKIEPLFKRCPNLPDQHLRLTSLSGDQIYQAIRGPFEKYSKRYRPEISDSLAKEIRRQFEERSGSAKIRLTELQIVCNRLFKQKHKMESYFYKKNDSGKSGVPRILEEYLEGAINSLETDKQEPAVALLTGMLTSVGTRDVISEDGLLNRVKNEDEIPRKLLSKTLNSLEKEAKLVRRERRRDVYYYEIASEFLVEWIQKKAQERKHRAEIRKLEEQAKEQARAHKRHQRISALLAAALLILSASIYLGYYCYWRPYVSYYNTYTKHLGIPKGVGKLKWDKVQRRSVSLKFTTKGRKGSVLKMEAIDSRGELTPKHSVGTYFDPQAEQISTSKECRWEYVRDSEGQIVYEKAYDKGNNLIWGLVYCPTVEGRRNRGAYYIGSDGYPKPKVKSAAEMVRFEYDDQGFEKLVRYSDRKHNSIRGPDKAFGRLQYFDELGLKTNITSIDDSNQPMIDEFGNATIKIKYDELGNLVEQVAYDDSNEITTVNDGWAKEKRWYDDSVGNLIEYAYFNVEDEPTLHNVGYHKGTFRYDSRGNVIEYSFYDVNGKPALRTGGYAHIVAQYDDDQHNQTRWACFDVNNKPTICSYGYHALELRYDGEGNVIEVLYLDIDSNPKQMRGDYAKDTRKYNSKGNLTVVRYHSADGMKITHTDGHHGFRQRYDRRGQVVEKTFFDLNEQPTLTEAGYASLKKEYDYYGNMTKISYFDTDNKLVPYMWYKYAGWKSKYNDRCKEVSRAYFKADVNEALLNGPDGYAEWRSEYDNYDRHTKESYFGTKGEPVLCKEGYASWKKEYDYYGNMTKISYLGLDGKLVLCKGYTYAGWKSVAYFKADVNEALLNGPDGYAEWRSEYDDYNRHIKESYFGTKGEPVFCKDGYASWKAKYDQHGNQIEKSYYGPDERLVLCEQGYARYTREYDDRDNLIGMAYYGCENELVLCEEGYARYTREYDDRDSLIGVAYYGCENELVLCEEGYARYTREYDDRGNLTGEAYYGCDGKPTMREPGYASWRAKYNPRGNQIEKSYYGTDGQLLRLEEGYAGWRAKYDRHGNQIEKSYYGTDGEPVSCEEGYARYSHEYDDRGNVIKRSFFGVEGEPYLFEGGYSGWGSKYDDHGNLIGVTYYGRDGKPTELEEGYAIWKAKYDRHGNQIEKSYYRANGKPASNMNDQGIARCTSKYDERGNLIKRFFFGVDGKPYLLEGGYSGWGSEYDDHGNQIGVTYYGRDGKPTELEEGYASWKAKYDQRRNQIEMSYYGADERPVLCDFGYFRLTQEFNERGQLLEMTTYDVEGNLVLNSSDFARVIREYDERGNLTEIAAFDSDEKPSNAIYGYARMILKYDERGNQVEEVYFGENGEPITLDDTYNRCVSKFDEHGNKIEETYYDPNDELVNRSDGYARLVRKFNERRQIIEERVFDSDNKPATVYNSYHIIRYKYDDRSNKIEEAYFGIGEKPVLYMDEDFSPYARWVAEYNNTDELIRKRYYDERNQLITSTRFAGPVRSAIIGTGDVGGIYYRTGRTISRMINNKSKQYNMKTIVKSTKGSVYNINAVLSSELDFGLAQSDRQYQAYKGEAEWSQSGLQKDLRAVFSIYPESITLIASAESGITSVADLRGRRVNMGSPGSGQLQNAKDVLSAFGIDLKSIKAEQKGVYEALELLQSGKIDAFFYTIGHPSENIKQATSGRVKVNIIPITGGEIDALLKKCPFYEEAVIPGNLYPDAVNKGNVKTIGVKATLVTSKNLDEEIVHAITKEVFDNLEDFKKQHPAFTGLTREDMLKGLSALIHKGALKYYEEAGLMKYIDPELRQ